MTPTFPATAHSQPSEHLTHPKYRPDIDGLRAVAVLSVVIFHAFPDLIPGGFIGVDVFFVISGFLISTIIFKSLSTDNFSFTDFYARRIKRIFPALFVVLLVTYGLGWHSLLADEFRQLGKHIAAGAGFVANLVFWSEAGYFDNASETKPLLHLWSLGIEEQFYIVWPLLLWLAWKRRLNLLVVTIAVALASFALNMTAVGSDEVAAFYSPQTRFWELLCGALLAWFTLQRKGTLVSAATATVKANPGLLSVLGLSMLAFGFWQITPEVAFPGIWAVLPVAGSVLIIFAGPQAWLNRTVLANRLMVWFGLISFPLYLWHWPLLSLARIVESGMPAATTRLAAVALATALAWLTYRFIEQPIRRNSPRSAVAILVVLMACAGGVGFYAYTRTGIPERPVIAMNAVLNSGFDGATGPYLAPGCGIEDPAQQALFAVCESDSRGNVRYALMGDSKAGALYAGLMRTSTEAGRWLFIGGNGPNGAPVPFLESDNDPVRPLTTLAINAIIANPNIDAVVLATAVRVLFGLSDGVGGGNLSAYDYNYLKKLNHVGNLDKTYEGVHRAVEKLVTAGKRVIIVVDNPVLPNPQDCVERKTSLPLVNRYLRNENPACEVPIATFNADIALYRTMLEKLQQAFPESVRIFDATETYCDADTGVCGPVKNGRMMYSFTDHISDYAAGLVGKQLNEDLAREVAANTTRQDE